MRRFITGFLSSPFRINKFIELVFASDFVIVYLFVYFSF